MTGCALNELKYEVMCEGVLGHAFRALLDSLFSGKAKTRFLASFLGIVEDSLIY